MNPSQLLDHFDRISEAPDAIPRLRRFILDLAVRGKLVDQDPNDEPASELLNHIQAEKARLMKSGGIRTEKPIPSLTEGDLPFQIPENWRWSQLAEVGFINPRNSAADDLPASFVPMPLISTEYGVANQHEVRPWGEIKSGFTHFAEGDVALAKITPCFENGKSTVFRRLTGGIGAGTTELHIIRPVCINADYVVLFLKCSHYIQTGIPRMTGTAGQKRVPTDYFAYSPFPLPPLEEQRRIVAKVDELMALCDQLEEAQAERENRRDRLNLTSLQRLNPSDDSIAFCEYANFHLRHLPRLTIRPEQVPQLRQTILNLAVQGKLVVQNAKDEPVSNLLARIQNDRSLLEKEGRIKKDKLLEDINSENRPFDVPHGWKWTRLGTLTELITKGSSPRWQGIEYVSKDNGIVFVTSENVGNYRLRKMDAPKYVEKRFNDIESRSVLCFGDLLINLVGASIGRTAVYDLYDVANINQAVALVRLVDSPANFCRDFLLHYFNSPVAISHMLASRVVTAQPNMSLTDVREFPVPIPPLAEQQRIAAKVDELIALCDRLEAQLTTTQTESRRLLEAVLQQALAPEA